MIHNYAWDFFSLIRNTYHNLKNVFQKITFSDIGIQPYPKHYFWMNFPSYTENYEELYSSFTQTKIQGHYDL